MLKRKLTHLEAHAIAHRLRQAGEVVAGVVEELVGMDAPPSRECGGRQGATLSDDAPCSAQRGVKTPNDPISMLKRDAQIIDALHIARYALVTHNSLTVRCEGTEWPINFEAEISKIDEVMTMLGVDLTQPLPAPTKGDCDD